MCFYVCEFDDWFEVIVDKLRVCGVYGVFRVIRVLKYVGRIVWIREVLNWVVFYWCNGE